MTYKFAIILTTLFSFHLASADWYTRIKCESNLSARVKNSKNKYTVINKNSFSLSHDEALFIDFLGAKSKKLIRVLPWEGIHYISYKPVKVTSSQSNEDSVLSLSFTYNGIENNIYCNKVLK